MDRSGTEKLRQFQTWGNIDFGRTINDCSNASIQLAPAFGGFDCCAEINGIVPWAFEISIYRNNVREWTGPITNVKRDSSGGVTISARDKMAWLMKRLMLEPLTLNADAADIFNYVIAHAMSRDPIPGLQPTATAAGVGFQREFVPTQLEKAFDVIQDLSRSAIDYTMLREVLLAGNFSVPTPSIGVITDVHIVEEPGFEYDGMQQANKWSVGGGGSGNRGFSVVSTFGGADADFGLLEDSVVESSIEDTNAAYLNASGRWALTHAPVLVGTEFKLAPNAPVTFDTLVPGAVVNLLLSDPCIPLAGQFRLQGVTVSVSASDDGLDETVSASVQPLGFEVLSS